MSAREDVLKLARRLEEGPGDSGLNQADAAMCVQALRRYAEEEAVFEVADIIQTAVGLPWYDPKVIQAARKVARLYHDPVEAPAEPSD
jgi:hypothetical protein